MTQDTYSNRLSTNFTFDEAVYSRIGNKLHLSNVPSPAEFETMKKAAVGMERVRALLGNKVISVSSWYRGHAVNLAVGSKESSQHRIGEAIDFNCFSFGSPLEVCTLIAANADLIRFDQLILENGWIHISFAVISKPEPRKQVLTITPDGKAHAGLVYYS
jgi:hypothetical protein